MLSLQSSVKSEQINAMLGASDYWRPDKVDYEVTLDGRCVIAKASLFNTRRSKNDHVHRCSSTGNIVVANARIDNRKELIDKLGFAGEEVCKEASDGELILLSYNTWGESCTNKLFGDFTFIVWDSLNQKLFAARDHFGVKFLLYAQTPAGILVSNEPAAFISSGWLKPIIKEEWLARSLWAYTSKAIFSYAGMELLPPAHNLTFSNTSLRTQKYWQLEDRKDKENEARDEGIEGLKKQFSNAVATRLDSEYPLCCELSEGLDSNGIAGYAAKLLPSHSVYTLSFECETLTSDNKHIWQDCYKDIEGMLDMHDNLEPLCVEHEGENNIEEDKKELESIIEATCGSVVIPPIWLNHYRLAQRQGARVILSGWGGDHCVSGYGDYYESELFRKFQWLKLSKLIKQRHKRGRGSRPSTAWTLLLLKHFCPFLLRTIRQFRGKGISSLWQRRKLSLLNQKYVKRYRLDKKLKEFIQKYERYSVKEQHQRELFDISPEKRLVFSELLARKWRVEYRYPMLDVALVEFAYHLPSALKCYNGIERFHFRKILDGITTQRIQWRVKSDVSMPNKDVLPDITAKELQALKRYLSDYGLNEYMNFDDSVFPGNDNPSSDFIKFFEWLLPVINYHVDRSNIIEKEPS